MDYETKPISRAGLRVIAKAIRKTFGCQTDDEPFPILLALEKLRDIFPNTTYQIVEDTDLPGNVFACCMPKPEGGFVIYIKQTVYDGAYFNNNTAFLSFICHEICHVALFFLGFTPVSNRTIKKMGTILRYRSVEWQAKALCGEVTIPYDATIGMKVKDIIAKYNVTEASAKYRVRQDKKIK